MSKLPLRERRYKALLNQIARLTLARNKAIKTIVKAETMLPGLERRARRLEFPTSRNKAASPEPQPISKDTAEVLTRLIGHPPSNPVKPEPTEAPVVTKPPKRVRKPKAKPLAETLEPETVAKALNVDRKAKMEALGFRKV